MPCKTDRCMGLLGLVVGDTHEEGEELVQMAQLQPAWEATQLSNFMQGAVKACCEGSLKQLSGKDFPSLFISRKAAALFAGRVTWKLPRLKKSKRQKKIRVSQFIQNTVVLARMGDHNFHSLDRKSPLGSHAICVVGHFWKGRPSNKIFPRYQGASLTIYLKFLPLKVQNFIIMGLL